MPWLRNSFHSGEISLAISKRTELPQRDNALLESLNTVHQPQGGVSKRPGCRVISEDGVEIDRIFPWYKAEAEKYIVGLYYDADDAKYKVKVYEYNFTTYDATLTGADGLLDRYSLFYNRAGIAPRRPDPQNDQFLTFDIPFTQSDDTKFTINGNDFWIQYYSQSLSNRSWVLNIRREAQGVAIPNRLKLAIFKSDNTLLQLWDLTHRRSTTGGGLINRYISSDADPLHDDMLINNGSIEAGQTYRIVVFQGNTLPPDIHSDTTIKDRTLTGSLWWEDCISAQHYGDTLILTCPEFPPLALRREGTDASPTFTFKPIEIRNPPMRKWNTLNEYNAEVTRIGTPYTANGNVQGSDKEQTFIWDGSTLERRSVNDDEVGKRQGYYSMIWNPVDGWPAVSELKDGRLVFAGSKSHPATIWYSVVGDALDFLDDTPLPDIPETQQTDESTNEDIKADYATSRRLNAFNPIVSLRSDTDLLVFTEGGEWSIEGVMDAEDITTARARQYGHLGSQPATGTAAIDDQVFYASKNSAQGLLYDSTFRGYIPYNITAGRNEKLLNEARVVRLAAAQPKNLNGSYLVFYLKDDGEIAVYHTLNKQEFMAWSRWNFNETIGHISDIACVDDDIYLLDARGRVHVMEPWLYQDAGSKFTTRIETCQLTYSYLRVPPQGYVTIKQLIDFHITAADASELTCKVRNSTTGDKEFKIPDNISAADPDEEPDPGMWGRRRVVLGITDVQAAYNKGEDMTMIIESNANAPLHIDRLDIQVEYNKG